MAGPVVVGGLPPLLPTPTSCRFFLTPRRSAFATGKAPGRADLSRNWNEDKLTGGGDRPRFPQLKLDGRAGTQTSVIERTGRPTWKGSWNEGKRSASRAPSADRSEKKARPPTEPEKQQPTLSPKEAEKRQYGGPTFTLSPKEGKMSPPTVEDDGLELEFAGPTFWFNSPEPSELPIPSFVKAL